MIIHDNTALIFHFRIFPFISIRIIHQEGLRKSATSRASRIAPQWDWPGSRKESTAMFPMKLAIWGVNGGI